MCKVPSWYVRLTIVAMEPHSWFLFIVELHVTANNIKALGAVQQFFYGEFVAGNNTAYSVFM